MSELDIQISIEEGAWPSEERLREMSGRVLGAAADYLRRKEKQPFPKTGAPEVSLVFTDDESIRAINAEWRSQDKPTNVLSFPQVQADLLDTLSNSDDGEILLGDIVLARETCVREALEKAVPIADHATHLIVHGTLHLVGYDHLDDPAADAMEALEVKALASLGIANPYAVQD